MSRTRNENFLEFFKSHAPDNQWHQIILGDIKNFQNLEIPLDRVVFVFCGAAGRLDIFREAVSRKLRFDIPKVCHSAVIGDHVELLNWLLDNSHVPIPKSLKNEIFLSAAKRGKLEILIFLNQKDPEEFPWSSKIPELAASRGHVNIF
jgi:hypothetical protein